ncbi:diacylglycerol/lipid kinase family protein [Companilactobacillus halodurans]|uniref:Diacylglycerol kinase family lipid kinase n=1 Tax=Companilactobacillus halodurans TaxID=2584183 RepID=A0A5P0ZW25_9LACO|nr:diacylglycerol kinase family protein [Companilactobacillus halodurans]MQS74929.1 diacylglycerol kinase family lipid kinase [Companilactobacillus halodurans]MQS97200.1 diacylglycerol kinase family lipid kinase [Companilactobacillus halodurans]
MEKEKIEIILNHYAGNGLAQKASDKVTNFLAKNKIPYEIHATKKDGDAIRIAKEIANLNLKRTKLVVIGGDGTLNQALNGVKSSDYPNTPLGYIPGGSGNDFCRGIQLKIKNPVILIQAILSMKQPRMIDVGKAVNEMGTHYFINNIGIGFDASTVYYTNHSERKEFLNSLHLGTLSYFTNLLKVIKRQKAFKLDVDEQQKKHFDNAYIVVATNHPYFGGGFAIDPSATPFNHKLNLVVVKKITGMTFVKLFTKLLTNGSHLQDKNVWHIESTNFRLQNHPQQHGQMDGEELGQHDFDFDFSINQHQFWLPVKN